MFWGLIMEPNRRYTQKVKKTFHISMASLDVGTSSDTPAQIMCGIDGRNYLLCTLRKSDVMQCPLDLIFTEGTQLSFAANGQSHVHLTGYLIDDYSSSEDLEEESDEETEKPVKKKKRINNALKNGPPKKKSKNQIENNDSDESDVDVEALMKKSFAEEDETDDTYVEEEENEEDDNDSSEEEVEEEGEEEEEENSSANESAEESNPTSNSKKSPQANGIPVRSQSTPKVKKNKPENETLIPSKPSKSPGKKTLSGGVVIQDIKEGEGPVAKSGKFVTVYYEGKLKQNNKTFDATTKGSGFSFRLGGGEVIKGWDIGITGMKLGGKRKIICPPAMAYGAKGSPPAIPGNSTLVFEVEMKKIR